MISYKKYIVIICNNKKDFVKKVQIILNNKKYSYELNGQKKQNKINTTIIIEFKNRDHK